VQYIGIHFVSGIFESKKQKMNNLLTFFGKYLEVDHLLIH